MDEEPPTWRGFTSNTWMWILMTLAVYVGGFGPAAKFYMTHPGAKVEAALEAFYFPILWSHDHTFLKEPLEAYLKLWGAL